MEFHIKMSSFSENTQFKKSKCTDGEHSLTRGFTVVAVKHSISKASFIRTTLGHFLCNKNSKLHYNNRVGHVIIHGYIKQGLLLLNETTIA